MPEGKFLAFEAAKGIPVRAEARVPFVWFTLQVVWFKRHVPEGKF